VLGNRFIAVLSFEFHFSSLPEKKSPAQTGEPGNVNQGASTIPLFPSGLWSSGQIPEKLLLKQETFSVTCQRPRNEKLYLGNF
jgi:hypothetical protein